MTTASPTTTPIPSEIEPYLSERELELIERADTLQVQDTVTEQAAVLVMGQLKESEDRLEAQRKAKLAPIDAQWAEIHEPHKKAIDFFHGLKTMLNTRWSAFKNEQKRLADAAQRKALEDQRKAQAEADAKAEVARQEAARKQKELEEKEAAGTVTAKDLKDAAKASAKADSLAEVAATPAPVQVIERPSNTVSVGGVSATGRNLKDWIYECGAEKGGDDYTRDNPRFQALPDSVFVVDETRIGKIIRGGGKVDGVRVVPKPSSSIKT